MSAALGAYRALTTLAEVAALPFAWAARIQGGDRAGRFGYGDARGATWVHAASVGEVTAAAPLVRALGTNRPQDDRIVSATTPGGLAAWRRELERRPPGGAPVAVAAWPLDFPGAVRRAFDHRRPRRLLITETEIWPNVLVECAGRGVRVAFANARLSERRWAHTRALAPLVTPLLSRVSACVAQSEADRERWAELGIPREALTVAGNTKYDLLQPAPDAAGRRAARARLGLSQEAVVWTWGSLRPGEEHALIDAARAVAAHARPVTIVAAPRHPDRADEIRTALTRARIAVEEWEPGAPWPAAAPGVAAVVWVPVLGVLRDLYEMSDAAVVGGTFAPFGGHNAAEPAALGVPVIVGPHHEGVRDVVESLVGRGGGRVAVSGREAAEVLTRWIATDAAHDAARAAARRAVEDLAGASARTLGFLEARGFWG